MRSVAIILAFIVALTSFACSGDSVTTPPSTQVPVTSVTVAGTVWLHDTGGVKPYANVQMNAYVEMGHSGQRTAPISSGPDGRYSFTVPDRRVGPRVYRFARFLSAVCHRNCRNWQHQPRRSRHR